MRRRERAQSIGQAQSVYARDQWRRLVVVEAEPLCMSMRGVQKPGAVTVTSAIHGVFREEVSTRLEAMRFIESNRRR